MADHAYLVKGRGYAQHMAWMCNARQYPFQESSVLHLCAPGASQLPCRGKKELFAHISHIPPNKGTRAAVTQQLYVTAMFMVIHTKLKGLHQPGGAGSTFFLLLRTPAPRTLLF